MTKNEEIATLQSWRASLPTDPRASYLGMWLDETMGAVIADIRNDIFPAVTTAEAGEYTADLIRRAEATAAGIVAKAERQAEEITAQAEHRSRLRRDAATRAISALRRAIDDIAAID